MSLIKFLHSIWHEMVEFEGRVKSGARFQLICWRFCGPPSFVCVDVTILLMQLNFNETFSIFHFFIFYYFAQQIEL